MGYRAESCAAVAEEDRDGLTAAEQVPGQQEMCLGQCLEWRVMCLIWNYDQSTFKMNSVCPYPKSCSMWFVFPAQGEEV